MQIGRAFMRSNFTTLQGARADQSKGVPPPPVQLPPPPGARIVDLPKPGPAPLAKKDIFSCIQDRRSRREFSSAPLSLAELSFLLWATQGIQEVVHGGQASLRTVPSGGARHAFETYLGVNRVKGLEEGLYRYLPLEHQLVCLRGSEGLREGLTAAALGQEFAGNAAVTFVWTCVPYRGEWRYLWAAHKTMLLDAGHVCQNLYLACEAIKCGTCGIAAYDQEAADRLVGADGKDEFVVYMAPVGRM
jgi:SagB-type dehydrogenase family enzyme